MTAKELRSQLQRFDPETEVWLPATTPKGIPTYAALGHLVPSDYGSVATDLTDTPDKIDTRLLGGRSEGVKIRQKRAVRTLKKRAVRHAILTDCDGL